MSATETSAEQRLDFQEMAAELEKYRQILETASDGFVTINENHEVVYMNRAAERIFGFSHEEVLGHDLNILLPPEQHANHRGYVERYSRTGRPHTQGQRIEVEAIRRSGQRFPAAIRFSSAHVGPGLLFTARIRDLSEQRDLTEQVRKSQRLAMVGQMVATVTHEIRTPLVLIGGFTAQVIKDKGISQRSRHKLTLVIDEVARLEALLNELRDISRPMKYKWREVHLNEVINKVVELMAPTLREQDVKLKVQSEKGLPALLADADRLSQVLINLINNAAQASEPHSQVTVTLSLRPGDGVLCRVIDHGAGISPENLRHILDPFFTTKDKGTGLGLPVAARIVEDHGGTLTLGSVVDQGTTAEIFLPLPLPESLRGISEHP